MLHLVRRAIGPPLGLPQCLAHWDDISLDLREAKRERTLQIAQLEK